VAAMLTFNANELFKITTKYGGCFIVMPRELRKADYLNGGFVLTGDYITIGSPNGPQINEDGSGMGGFQLKEIVEIKKVVRGAAKYVKMFEEAAAKLTLTS
jgi:hypothetical protein